MMRNFGYRFWPHLILIVLVILLVFTGLVWLPSPPKTIVEAQAQMPVNVTPDCVFYFDFTATGRSAQFQNKYNGCTTWTIVYFSTGFSALSLRLESAPDVAGVVGTWGAFSGTLQTGVNPNTATTSASTTMTGYNPWVSANLTSVTGTGRIIGFAYGYRTPPVVTVAVGGVPAAVNITQVGGSSIALGQAVMASSFPVVIASNQTNVPANLVQVGGTNTVTGGVAGSQGVGGLAANGAAVAGNPMLGAGWDGTNAVNDLRCTNQQPFDLSGSGNTQIIALSGSTSIRICHISLATTAAEDIRITSGTGSNCAGATTNVSGLYKSVSALALDPGWAAPIKLTAAHAACINQSVAQALGGIVVYAQF